MNEDMLAQNQLVLGKVQAVFDSRDIKNRVKDIYKDVHLVFKDVINNLDLISIDMNASLVQPILLEAFQAAYLIGESNLPDNLKLLDDWIEGFARQAKEEKISQENYLFLSAGIIFGIANMIREFNEIKLRGL